MCIVAPEKPGGPGVWQGADMAAYRCAILDDYQNVALGLADWSKITEVEVKVFNEPVRRTDEQTIHDVKDFDIVVMMRERMAWIRSIICVSPE